MTHSLDELRPVPDAAHTRGSVRQIELLPNKPVSVDAVRGTVVRSLRGSLWLTQEGHWQDYVLVPGVSYVSLDDGRIVVSAQDQGGAASVFRTGLAPGNSECDAWLNVSEGAIARIEREARRAQGAEVVHWIGILADALAGAWRRLTGADKPADNGTRGHAA